MSQAIFKRNINGQLQDCSYHDLFAGRRVLVCSVNNPHNRVTQVYMKYLQQLAQQIQEHRVDCVYTINSFDIWSIPIVEKFFPGLVPVVNQDRRFVGDLISSHNNASKWSELFLAEFWEYQVLLEDGHEEWFAHSDTENMEAKVTQAWRLSKSRWDRVDSDKRLELLYMQRQLQEQVRQDPQLVLRQPEFYWDTEFTRNIRYQGLWPSTQLLSHLANS